MKRRPVVGVTMGDAAGIGPEIIIKALSRREVRNAAACAVYGSPEVMVRAAEKFGFSGSIRSVDDIRDCSFPEHDIEVIRCAEADAVLCPVGKVSAVCGDLAFRSVVRAVTDAQAGLIDAAATGPINKESLQAAGHQFAGHTEIFAHYTGTKDYTMMLIEGNLRVVHVSTHVSLREALDLVKTERIITVISLAHQALRDMGITDPRIAVAGLNPHAGEGGLFGREEIEEIIPAVEASRDQGAVGPIPADTVFSRAAGGEFDAVAAMYHDQGHIPLKMAGFRYGGAQGPDISGVNVTLGTPVIRCSVDHGTAFDLAEQGGAHEGSMVSAVMTAAAMAARRAKRV